MTKAHNPWDIPEWHFVKREAALIRHLIGSGITALGRANYADRTGEYYTAFFALSIGLERLCKLILVADAALAKGGQMPNASFVRAYGHKLKGLIEAADSVSQKRNLKLRYPRCTHGISLKIIECLDDFADAGRGRYANFAALGDPNLGSEEPVRKWWKEVAEAILNAHYYGTKEQERVESNARLVDAIMGPFTLVSHTSEVGAHLDQVLSASVLTGQTSTVQRYGRFYALQMVRWLSEIFSEVCQLASYGHSVDAFYGAWEYVSTYLVEDHFLRTRKNWPLG
ncbi:hypothetical protein ACQKLX_23955 [Bosea sp. NPDC003192]|uniref:hypothetical protein n=1 Tax=Bosea sp. NPDC003192 TaxID=3390551 RepID=UPI003D02B319